MSNSVPVKQIQIKSRNIDLKDYKLRSAVEADVTTLIKESCVLVEDGHIKVIYLDLDEFNFDALPITKALESIKYQASERTGGLKTISRIFGYAPRVTLRKDFCSATSLIKDFPTEHDLICEYAKQITDIYRSINPEVFEQHMQESKKVLKEWTIEDTPFTSGIINKNNPLKYHFDTGNFKNVFSCMLGFKKDIEGGYLSLPDYDCMLEIKNNSLLIFDGQNILHGVTPIKKRSEQAYRYTIVYYSLKAMWNCLPLNEEIIRIRKLKTDREFKRAEAQAFKDVR